MTGSNKNLPLRQIILDTETTGLEISQGHRIIEIGALELVERRPSGRQFHQYLNPDREIEAGASEIHGITNEDVANEPRFSEVAEELMEFLSGAELIIHNAPFDVGFLDYELELDGRDWSPLHVHAAEITDTLVMAREMHPGQRNSLDALCRRYEVDNSNRTLHGALLDAELLAEVYLAMTGGQVDLGLSHAAIQSQAAVGPARIDTRELQLPVVAASEQELKAHQARLADIDEAAEQGCLWLQKNQGGRQPS